MCRLEAMQGTAWDELSATPLELTSVVHSANLLAWMLANQWGINSAWNLVVKLAAQKVDSWVYERDGTWSVRRMRRPLA